jgi:glycosyltransferase involved in cell wall biosynthesis
LARIVILVTSDVIADQRVHRTAQTLINEGHCVIVIGRRKSETPKKVVRQYKVILLRLLFSKGVFFYITFNLKAILYLLFKRFDLIHSNDLDTLIAGRKLAFLKRTPLIYDSHELFTEVPELINRKAKKMIWRVAEKIFASGIEFSSTVSVGVANELKRRYGLKPVVIRNLPFRQKVESEFPLSQKSKTLIYQGALNIGRGLEKLIEAMQWVDANLIIVGSGDIENDLKHRTNQLKLNSKVKFLGKVKLEELGEITRSASLGVSLEEDFGLSYRYALPNKLFDYIQVGLPVLTTNLPEMDIIVKQYGVGLTISPNCDSKELATTLNLMLNDSIKMEEWRKNSIEAAKELNWERESEKLVNLVDKALKKY